MAGADARKDLPALLRGKWSVATVLVNSVVVGAVDPQC